MAKAIAKSITSQSYQYLDDGLVLVSLETATGEMVRYTVSSATFMASICLATQLVNENLNEMLADLLCRPGAEHVGAVH